MAKNRKKQRAEAASKGPVARAAEVVKDAVAGAARSAAKVVEDKVVEPVGKALGVVEKSAKEKYKARTARPPRRVAKKAAPRERVRRTPAGKMLASAVAKTVVKPTGGKASGKRG